MTHASYAGVDVAKGHLDVGTATRSMGRYSNTLNGWGKLAKRLRASGIRRVAFESTGGYERSAAEYLQAQGFAVSIVKPGSVRKFAQSMDLLAKSDQIDAKVIARFAEAKRPRELEIISESQQHLRSLHDRRQQVIEDRVREQGRLESCRNPQVRKDIQCSIERLKKEESLLAKQIADLIREDQELSKRSDRLQQECGVGLITAATVQAHFPELGRVSRGEATALAGLAPFERSSGKWQGQRRIAAGRAPLRKALYMAAVTACKYESGFKAFYQRLIQKGKKPKVALIAVARKLLLRLNAIEKAWLKDQETQFA